MLTQANLKLIATILVIVGALNWLAIGLQNTNYVSRLTGQTSSYVYVAVGAAGIYLAYLMIDSYRKTGMLESYQDAEEQMY